ncbi:uncharacterized protein LOC131619795 [Vicia villosa]|uniref:uncharacterized protein LOC131619795 n=1 Tax=Vicia villosa TaxID=3911 RepID=UPI00273BE0B9|nr:uncharacterized protein LOC131619795 [Vicia villosa]
MSVLVNGSTTKEFEVKRGLRQGDPLSPFLYVIVAEGLKGLVNKAVENRNFLGFNINGKCNIDIHQFANDTLSVGEGSWNHIWAINRLEDKKITFLGILSGANPRRLESWRGLVNKLKKRLSSWKGHFLSFGGRITLLKSVLSSLAIFTLSFYKSPIGIIKEITRIQSNFLWGGSEELRKIHWVSWKALCLPVEKGGLGFRRVGVVNEDLLNKWRWRILDEEKALWYKVLKARYGDINLLVANGERGGKSRIAKSAWWKDIISLVKEASEDIFAKKETFIVSNGFSVSFWLSSWLPCGCLRDLFPSLFSLSRLKEASLGSMGGWMNEVREWGDLGISYQNIPGFTEAMFSLREILLSFSPLLEGKYKVVWKNEV